MRTQRSSFQSQMMLFITIASAPAGTDSKKLPPINYVVFNTFFALLTQEAQIKCFQASAQHLRDDGVFVLENFVPDLTRFDRGQCTYKILVSVDQVRIDAAISEPLTQRC